MKKLYSSIILLIIGGLIVKSQILIGDGCQGMLEVLLFILLSFIYIIILVIFLTISTVKFFRKKSPFNYYPLVTTIIVVISICVAVQSEKFESSTVLYATSANRNSIKLLKNSTFKIQVRAIEWSCYYKGKYKIKNDTLSLLKTDIQSITDSLFTNKYLIDKNKKILYQLNLLNHLNDTTRRLYITDEEK